MITKESTIVSACTGDILFGERPQNYTDISADISEGDEGFFLTAYDERGEISPTAETLCCGGKYLWDQGVRECPVTVRTPKDGGEYRLLYSTCAHRVTGVTAGLGRADFVSKNIPLRFEKSIINDRVVLPECKPFRMTALRFHSPYAVIFMDTAGDCLLIDQGNRIGKMNLFPQGAEVLFVYARGEKELYIRACHRDRTTAVRGNDVCAALAAAVATGRCLPDTAVTAPLDKGTARAVCSKAWELFLTLPMLS